MLTVDGFTGHCKLYKEVGDALADRRDFLHIAEAEVKSPITFHLFSDFPDLLAMLCCI